MTQMECKVKIVLKDHLKINWDYALLELAHSALWELYAESEEWVITFFCPVQF